MKVEINYSQVPPSYMICLNEECPLSDTCLRQLVEQNMPVDVRSWTILRPTHLATLKNTCPYYRAATKVRYGKGFLKLLENLPYKQMQTVAAHLLQHFGRRTYYRVRKGERLLSPSEQQCVLDILENCGVSHPQEFDSYIEKYDW